MRNDKSRSPAYMAVLNIYANSPGKSWRRLADAIDSALRAAITAHLPFIETDFTDICEDFKGGYWMGDSGTLGERYYCLAVKVEHTPACISFEKYANRPAALWAEDVKTPSRLCVGSEFTWEGCRVIVTTMKQNHFVACSYKSDSDDGHDEMPMVGEVNYVLGHYRLIESFKDVEGGGLLLRAGPKCERPKRRPDRVFKIKYEDLAAKRKEYDAARRKILADIRGSKSLEELAAVREAIKAKGRSAYRHFDIEDFRAAFAEWESNLAEPQLNALNEKREAERLKQWLAGENVGSMFTVVKLRIKGVYVETSTGHSATVESAKKLLPWAMIMRRKGVTKVDKRLDVYDIRGFTKDGIQIGCTLVPWSEIDRIKPELEAA